MGDPDRCDTRPTIMLDLAVLGLSEDFVIRLPFDAPDDLVVGAEVWVVDVTVEPRLFEVAESAAPTGSRHVSSSCATRRIGPSDEDGAR